MTLAELVNRVGFKVNNEDVQNVNSTIQSIKSTATKVLGFIGIGFSLSQLNALADEFNGINDKLNYALEYSEDMKDVQKEIVAAANNCKASYGDMVDTIVNLKQANSEVFPVEEAATFVEYVNKLGKTAGYSDGEISSMQSSIQRIVASGTMGASDITRIARTTPALIEQICNGLGVTREQLEAMADAGQITAETIKTSIMNSAETIDANFDRLDYSIGDAMLNIRNQWGYFVDDLNATTGLSMTIAKGMVSAFSSAMSVLNKFRNGVVWLTDKLGGMENILKVVGIAAAATFAFLNFDKVTSGLTSVTKLLKNINFQTMAIIAVIVLLALLVEDFFNFMQGNNSVIGTLFEKAGIDADAAREKIIKAWETIKTFLIGTWKAISGFLIEAWDTIKQAAGMFADIVFGFFQRHGDSILDMFKRRWGLISTLLSGIWTFISQLATTLFGDTEKSIDGSTQSTKEKLLAVWQVILSTLSTIWDTLFTVGETIFNALAAVIETVFSWIQAFWNSWGGQMLSLFKTIWDTMGRILNDFLRVVTGVASFISVVFKGDWQGAWDAIKQIFSGVWDAIAAILGAGLETIKLLSSMALSAIKALWEAAWNGIKSFFSGILDWIEDKTGLSMDGVRAIFSNALTIIDGFQAAIDWITGLPAKAVQWGADIIQGIVDGITSAVGKIGDAAKGVADKIASFLHFSIPDEGPLSDFDRSMPDMMQLMAEGIRKGKSVVNNAIKDLTGDMSNDVRDVDIDNDEPKPKPKPTGGAGSFFSNLVDGMKVFANAAKPQAGTVNTVTGSNNVSRSVVQNIEINNKYEGDRAGQQKSSQAAKEAGKDITAELARGLQYTR